MAFNRGSGLLWLIVAIALGIGFRLSHLDDKIFWVDEVATAIRVAGYTRAEVIQQLSDGRLLSVSDLQYYMQVGDMQGGGRSLQDTFNALAQSPEHTPLYFLLTRLWVDGWGSVWGSSAASFRSVSVVASLLTLPSLYWLSVELFRSRLTGAIAVVLFALSPFFVSYAQEARPYSLWVLLLTLSGAVLLWALRRNRPSQWLLYGLLVALCAYTSLLSLPVLVGQGLYAIATTSRWGSRWLGTHRDSARAIPNALMALSFSGRLDNRARHALIALGVGLLTLLPWLGLALGRWDTLQDNTTWMRAGMDWPLRLIIGLYTLAVLVFDVPVAPMGSPALLIEVGVATGIVAIFAVAVWILCRRSPVRVWLWVVLVSLPTPLLLLGLDLVLGGQRSTAPRYLMPVHLGLILTLAYALSQGLVDRRAAVQQRWRWVAIVLLSVSLLSCGLRWQRSPKYQKTRNLDNPAIAQLINAEQSPLLVAEPDETLDILSLSGELDDDSRIRIVPTDSVIAAIATARSLGSCQASILIFNPSAQLQQQLMQVASNGVKEVFTPQRLVPEELALTLWQVGTGSEHCAQGSGSWGTGDEMQQWTVP